MEAGKAASKDSLGWRDSSDCLRKEAEAKIAKFGDFLRGELPVRVATPRAGLQPNYLEELVDGGSALETIPCCRRRVLA